MNDREQKFVLAYLGDQVGGVDILNAGFVDAFIEKFNPPFKPTMYGAFKCPKLGRLLGAMHRGGLLDRRTIGLHGMEYGFPNWVYIYTRRPLGEL